MSSHRLYWHCSALRRKLAGKNFLLLKRRSRVRKQLLQLFEEFFSSLLQFHLAHINKAESQLWSGKKNRSSCSRHTVRVIAFYKDLLWGKVSWFCHWSRQSPTKSPVNFIGFHPISICICWHQVTEFLPTPPGHGNCSSNHPRRLLPHEYKTPTTWILSHPPQELGSSPGSQFRTPQCKMQA